MIDLVTGDVDVFWVGLSAKLLSQSSESRPLGVDTLSGQILRQVEDEFSDVKFYSTNLVKCPPLNGDCKLRYPNVAELNACMENLNLEIDHLKPTLIFLLGKIVSSRVMQILLNSDFEMIFDRSYDYNIYSLKTAFVVPIHHPSYVGVYKKKELNDYRTSISRIIRECLNLGDKI